MEKFKVYYRDGSTYVGPPENVPILGVALILQHSPEHGREIIAHGDYYTLCERGWLACGYDSMLAYMNEPGLKKRFLVGVQMFPEDWNAVYKKAEEDPDFPPRTAYTPREKHHRNHR